MPEVSKPEKKAQPLKILIHGAKMNQDGKISWYTKIILYLKVIAYKCEVCTNGRKDTKLMAGNNHFYQFIYGHLASRRELRILIFLKNFLFSFFLYQQKIDPEITEIFFEKNIKIGAKNLIFLKTMGRSEQ